MGTAAQILVFLAASLASGQTPWFEVPDSVSKGAKFSDVKAALRLNAASFFAADVRGTSGSYLSERVPLVVFDVQSRFDESNVLRVRFLRLRLPMENEHFVLMGKVKIEGR